MTELLGWVTIAALLAMIPVLVYTIVQTRRADRDSRLTVELLREAAKLAAQRSEPGERS